MPPPPWQSRKMGQADLRNCEAEPPFQPLLGSRTGQKGEARKEQEQKGQHASTRTKHRIKKVYHTPTDHPSRTPSPDWPPAGWPDFPSQGGCHRHKKDSASRAAQPHFSMPQNSARQSPGTESHRGGQQPGRSPEKLDQKIRQLGSGHPTPVLYFLPPPTVKPAGIKGMETGKGKGCKKCQRNQQKKKNLGPPGS